MGYDIYIGEVTYNLEEDVDQPGNITILIPQPKKFYLHEAPSLAIQNDLTRRTNRASLPHSWNFLAEAGLDGWIGRWLDLKTNVYPLKEEDYQIVHTALEKWLEEHPQNMQDETVELDETLQRLIWFDWWVRWALGHCQPPVIYSWG